MSACHCMLAPMVLIMLIMFVCCVFALTGGEVQRGGLAARGVSAVHILGSEQFLDPLQLSASAGLEQLPARCRLQHRRRAGPSRAAPQRHPHGNHRARVQPYALSSAFSSLITQLNATASVHSSLCNIHCCTLTLQYNAETRWRGATPATQAPNNNSVHD